MRRTAARIVASVCLLLAMLLAGRPLPAQPRSTSSNAGTAQPPSRLPTDRKAEAQERFQRGLALARSQNWDAALAEFAASRELYPTRSATRNAAIALHKLHRYVEACETYEALLTQFSSTMPAEQVAQVRDELVSVVAQTGEITIEPADSGVSVVVDGKQRGVTPLSKPIRVDPGTHTVRLAKAGFESQELRFSLAAGSEKRADGRLRRLADVGSLTVRESSGQSLDVLIDAGLVGTTPWTGSLAPGVHVVQLRGPGIVGTPPSAVKVKPGDNASLLLRSMALQSWVRVEPRPLHANVFIDGVGLGTGTWEGRLQTGSHRIEATAPGHLPFRAEVRLEPGERRVVSASLRSESEVLRPPPRRLPLYATASAGLALARSFGGDADARCECSERARPVGGIATGRFGVTLLQGLGLEVGGGYLILREQMTRDAEAVGDGDVRAWTASNYEDTTRLAGPLVAIGASYRVLERFPLTARTAVGLVFLRSTTTNFGTFQGVADDGGHEPETIERQASIPEGSKTLLTPTAEIELRAGYRITKQLTLDLGLALWAFFPPRETRQPVSGAGDRYGVLSQGSWSNGDDLRPGSLTLRDETIARWFIVVSPSVGAQLTF